MFFKIPKASATLDTQRYIQLGQALQGECLGYIFGEYRLRKFECSGLLMWMFSDCYPASCWSLIDYYLGKKAAYFYTKRAFAPMAAIFCGYQPNLAENLENWRAYYAGAPKPVTLALVNDEPRPWVCTYRVALMGLNGQVLECRKGEATVAANGRAEACAVTLEALAGRAPEAYVLICEGARSDGMAFRARYFFAPFYALRLETPTVTLTQAGDGVVEVESPVFVWLCHLRGKDGEAQFSENDFDLFPGQKHRVATATPAAKISLRSLNNWNCSQEEGGIKT
jgi:beta-mannosidase